MDRQTKSIDIDNKPASKRISSENYEIILLLWIYVVTLNSGTKIQNTHTYRQPCEANCDNIVNKKKKEIKTKQNQNLIKLKWKYQKRKFRMNSLIECNLILHIYSHWNNTNRQITNKFTTMSQSSVSMGKNSNILISFDIMGAHTAHHTHTHTQFFCGWIVAFLEWICIVVYFAFTKASIWNRFFEQTNKQMKRTVKYQ